MPDPIQPPDLADTRLRACDKGIPVRAVGLTVAEFLATRPRLPEFWTPLVALDDQAIRHNLAVMARWTSARGLDLMPHGKTTMAPALWRRQLEAGCRGITLATMGQVRTARSFGIGSIMLANEVVDERSLSWLAGELADADFRFICWADSLAAVEAMNHALRTAHAPRMLDVCVELGAVGGRAGARSLDEAFAVGHRIAASDQLRLAGVAGYEGILGHDRGPASLEAVRTYLANQLELHRRFADLYDDADIYVSAGGSAYFDLVADAYAAAIAEDAAVVGPRSLDRTTTDVIPGTVRLPLPIEGTTAATAPLAGAETTAPASRRTHYSLRAGCYLVHDHGFYRSISPLGEAYGLLDTPDDLFQPAMIGLARVLSTPEPGLALLDGGKRDFPIDEGYPIPLALAPDLDGPWTDLAGASITTMNDQHTYLRYPASLPAGVGDVVRLGLSHPCTTFDKWRFLPLITSSADDQVIDLVQTFF